MASLPPELPRGLLLATVLAILTGGYLYMRDAPLVEDEVVHANQIRRFIRGQFFVDPDLTTVPGYHAVVAAAGWLASDSSTAFLRGVQVLLSLASVVVFHRLA